MSDEQEKPTHFLTPQDIWISSTMVGVILSILMGVLTIKDSLTRSAVEQEARFIRLEESVKALKEQIIRMEVVQ